MNFCTGPQVRHRRTEQVQQLSFARKTAVRIVLTSPQITADRPAPHRYDLMNSPGCDLPAGCSTAPRGRFSRRHGIGEECLPGRSQYRGSSPSERRRGLGECPRPSQLTSWAITGNSRIGGYLSSSRRRSWPAQPSTAGRSPAGGIGGRRWARRLLPHGGSAARSIRMMTSSNALAASAGGHCRSYYSDRT